MCLALGPQSTCLRTCQLTPLVVDVYPVVLSSGIRLSWIVTGESRGTHGAARGKNLQTSAAVDETGKQDAARLDAGAESRSSFADGHRPRTGGVIADCCVAVDGEVPMLQPGPLSLVRSSASDLRSFRHHRPSPRRSMVSRDSRDGAPTMPAGRDSGDDSAAKATDFGILERARKPGGTPDPDLRRTSEATVSGQKQRDPGPLTKKPVSGLLAEFVVGRRRIVGGGLQRR